MQQQHEAWADLEPLNLTPVQAVLAGVAVFWAEDES